MDSDRRNLKLRESDFLKNFYKYRVELIRYAQAILINREVAEDVVHDVFEKLWKCRNEVYITGSVKGYALLILRNQCLNYLKHQKVEMKYVDAGVFEIETLYHPEVWFEDQDLENNLRKVINKLPPQTKKIFCMSRFDEFSNSEIAWRMGIKKRTVEVQISNALRFIRKEF
ncbi:MAG: RNA polymerase sigma-70 factor [Marinilabiliaceae bacterium]|nr:RNA polymerase sigma-70 factor [Marinilabiliaceae bacterium]